MNRFCRLREHQRKGIEKVLVASGKPSFVTNSDSIRFAHLMATIKYLSQDEAIYLDRELMNEYAFSLDQLMELAGLSIASAIAYKYSNVSHGKPVICCGPGNNGGDGLVCARHLKQFGYQPTIICPRLGRGKLFENLLTQCRRIGITILEHVPNKRLDQIGNLVVDCVFGFSFKPPNRSDDFANLLRMMHEYGGNNVSVPLVSVDVPSGWNVNTGDQTLDQDQSDVPGRLKIPALQPECLISLTAPKLSARYHKGLYHFLGGRFVPEPVARKYNLNLPEYPNQSCFLEL